jgi:glycosyltransferase involved in cell wall biosynthesis
VLATDCGGNRELVRDGETGRLVPGRASAADVAGAWASLLSRREAAPAMGRRGRAWVERHHAAGRVLDEFRRFYDRLAAHASAPPEESGRP